jgi:hypothetical protein
MMHSMQPVEFGETADAIVLRSNLSLASQLRATSFAERLRLLR